MSKQANILVVDDEATIREVVRKYLEHEGYRVAEAETGTEALAYLREQRPDLLILDLMLPGMDGFAITRSVRNAKSLKLGWPSSIPSTNTQARHMAAATFGT